MDRYYNTDEFKKTLKDFEENKRFFDSEELADIAEYYHLTGDDKKSLEVADYAVSLYPGSLYPLAFKSHMALVVDHDSQLAEELAEQIEDKMNIEYFFLKAEIMLYRTEIAEANEYLLSQFDENVSDEDWEDYVLGCTELFLDYEETEFAEQWLERSELTDDEDYKEFKARILKNKGEFEESEQILNELLDEEPYSADYWDYLAQTQLMHDSPQDAITSCNYALAINPKDDLAMYHKACALSMLGNYNEAIKCYKRYKELAPENLQSSVSIAISHLYMTMHDLPNTKKWFDKAIQESHNIDETSVQFGISLSENYFFEHAYDMLSTHLPALGEKWKYGYANLARCCYELELPQKYDEYLRIAVERNPDEAVDVLSDLYPKDMPPEEYHTVEPLRFQNES